MEAETEISEQIEVSNAPEDVPDKEITTDDEQISLDTTIQVENSSLKSIPLDNGDIDKPTSEVSSENGKKKSKDEKPPTKIVVRRLPPTMTKDGFLEQVSPVPELDYMYYVQGDTNYGVHSFSRAYLNFVNQEDLFSFSATFDNYVFLDSKGQEFPAVVEFAMFQRVPKMKSKKKDPLMGTIESDPTFIAFKENLLAEALENSKPGGKTIKQHYFETEISTTEEVNTTPLLEYLKVRRAEKARMREERREEKKRKELERKMKQKKDKKGGEEAAKEDEGKDVKVLQGKERRDGKDREGRNGRKKEDREKVKETRPREFKNRGGKSYQEERLKLAERREEQKKREMLSAEKKYENTEGGDVPDTSTEQAKGGEDKPQRGGDRKRYEHKKGGKFDNEDWKEEGKKRGRTERNMGRRDRKEDMGTSRRGPDKKNGESDSRRRGGKSYKSSEQRSSGADKRKLTATENRPSKGEVSKEMEANEEEIVTQSKRCRSVDDIRLVGTSEDNNPTNDEEAALVAEPEPKRRSSSLGRLPSEGDVRRNTEPHHSSNSNEKREAGGDGKGLDLGDRCPSKDPSVKRYSSERSRKKEGHSKSDESQECSRELVRSRAQECKTETEGSSRSAKEAALTERRIRNKDRPSIELYRPGMGKFSKQRLEKEKTLGSSTEVDSPSHSPSPTPRACNKPTSSPV